LHLAVRSLDIGPGDEVITTPYSFIASSNCILYERATPVFVDIEEKTLGLDPNLVEEAITPKTKAILAVHVYGKSCLISELREICDRYGLYLIEDCCEALGTYHGGVHVGSFGHIATYGFYPNKHITTGEGGMLTTSDEHIAKIVKSLRNQGRNDNMDILEFQELGYNYRLNEVAAALGLGQILEFDEIRNRRKQIFDWYHKMFSGTDSVHLLAPSNTEIDSPFTMVAAVSRDREKLIAHLMRNDIQSRAYFDPPIHLQKIYISNFGYKKGDFPVAEEMSASLLAIPFFTSMTEDQVKQVCDALSNY